MKKTAMFIFAIALCSSSVRAQQPEIVQWNAGFPFDGVAEDVPATMQKIFSNLGPAAAAYVGSAWLVKGPNTTAGGNEEFIALPFKSAKAAHVEQIRAAVQWESGAKQVRLSLYSDSSGHPGTLLAGPVTVKNLQTFYTCCKLATANLTTGFAITAGTQYWIVADTPSSGTGSDFSGAWSFVPSKIKVGADTGTGWYWFQGDEEPAGAVYGTIP